LNCGFDFECLLSKADIHWYTRRGVAQQQHKIVSCEFLGSVNPRDEPRALCNADKSVYFFDRRRNRRVDVDGRPAETSGDDGDPSDDGAGRVDIFEEIGDCGER
jgi:hypothetical protein